MSGERRRRGRPRAEEGVDTEEAILKAAVEEFSEHGYDGTSIRGVARRAGVDPALVHRHFGDKAALFAALLDTPVDPTPVFTALAALPPEQFVEAFVRGALTEYDDPEKREQMTMLVRASVGSDQMAHLAKAFVTGEVVERFRAMAVGPNPGLRADLVSTQLFGLFVVRYVFEAEPLARASHDEIVALIAPTIHRYLFEE